MKFELLGTDGRARRGRMSFARGDNEVGWLHFALTEGLIVSARRHALRSVEQVRQHVRGGVRFDSLDPRLMCRSLPGVFCAGEMLDWEAPTGGYLLTACLASGRAAARAGVRLHGGS